MKPDFFLYFSTDTNICYVSRSLVLCDMKLVSSLTQSTKEQSGRSSRLKKVCTQFFSMRINSCRNAFVTYFFLDVFLTSHDHVHSSSAEIPCSNDNTLLLRLQCLMKLDDGMSGSVCRSRQRWAANTIDRMHIRSHARKKKPQ